ncbi:neutral zinc metallopeptidase, partial [Rhodopirellula europaea]
MRWRGRRQSDNVEDRRTSGGGAVVGGGIGVIVIAIIIGLLGGNPQQFLQQAAQQPAPGGAGGQVELTPQEIEAGEFVSTVFADTEDVWTDLFSQAGREYKKPTLVLFKDQVNSG